MLLKVEPNSQFSHLFEVGLKIGASVGQIIGWHVLVAIIRVNPVVHFFRVDLHVPETSSQAL